LSQPLASRPWRKADMEGFFSSQTKIHNSKIYQIEIHQRKIYRNTPIRSILEDWQSQKGPTKGFKIGSFFCLIKNFNEAEHSKNVFCMCLWSMLKFSKRSSKIRESRSWYQMEGLARRNAYVKYESTTTLWPRLKFSKRSNSKVRGSRSWYQTNGLARRNTHAKYESLSNYQSNVMTKVKVLEKKVKLHGQRSRSWYQMKGLARINTHFKYGSLPPTNQEL
jgi:hypothetical protein